MENADVYKFHIANKWLCLRNKNSSILDSLYARGITGIIVYGATELAQRLMEECEKEDSRISLLGIADKQIGEKGGYYKEIPLIPIDQLAEMNSEGVMIVVTAVGAMKEIMADLQKRGVMNVITLQDLVYDAYDYQN